MFTDEFSIPEQVVLQKSGRKEHEPKDKVEKDYVIPLLEGRVPFDEVFPEDTLESLLSSCDPEIIVNTAINDRLLSSYTRLEIGAEQAKRLLEQDLRERAVARYELVSASAMKIHVAELVQKAVRVEQGKHASLRIPGVSEEDLDNLQNSAKGSVEAFNAIAIQSLDIDVDPVKDAQAIQSVKTRYVYQATNLSATSVALERVSPTTGQKGPIQNLLSETTRVVADRSPGTYVRTHAGTYAHLLGLNIAREYNLPRDTKTSGYEVECFASGMAAITTVMDKLALESDSETVLTSGFYFEIPEYAMKNGIVKKTADVNEKFYTDFGKRLQKDIGKPLVYYAQPFSSGIGDEVFDVDRFLKVIEQTDYDRPLTLVIDSTMHGAALDIWDRVDKITSSKKNFTLIRVESMVKHGQLGTDKVPGGVALAYGSNPRLIRGLTAARGSMMPEFNASYLLPFSGETQSLRIARAGRNAEFMANYLEEHLADNPLIDGVYYATSESEKSKEIAKQYATNPPFLFIKVNNAVAEFLPSWLSNEISGHLSRRTPAGGHGASYGFDGTRVDEVVINENGETYLRIAAGQESAIQLLSLTHMLEQMINDPKWRSSVGHRLRNEMYAITSPVVYSKDTIQNHIYFNPQSDPLNGTDRYVGDLSSQPVISFLSDQSKGRSLVDEFAKSPRLAEALDIDQSKIEALQNSLSSPKEVEIIFNSWAITQPRFIDIVRSKLSVAGKSFPREMIYSLAKQCVSSAVAHAALLPIAKTVKETLKQAKEEFENTNRLKLPF